MAADDLVLTGIADAPGARVLSEQAFHACFRRTAGPLRAYVAKVTGDWALADDIVQEAYLRLLRTPPATDDPDAQRAWLIRIASNLMVDHWRRRQRERRDAAAHQVAPHAEAADVPLRMDMTRIFATLKPAERQMMWLAYVEGANHREIGAALGVGERSVKVLLHRARRKLAGLLRDAGLGRGDR